MKVVVHLYVAEEQQFWETWSEPAIDQSTKQENTKLYWKNITTYKKICMMTKSWKKHVLKINIFVNVGI